MVQQYYGRPRQTKKKNILRIFIFLFLLTAVAVLALFSLSQYMMVQSLSENLDTLESKIDQIEEENEMLWEQYDEIYEENEKLREENRMLRSSTVINNGNRETSKVAITIDDGAHGPLIHRTLDHLKEHNVRATLFPMGSWVKQEPEVWQRAVNEGHELGNHTYSHAFLSTVSDEKVREELNGWQESVNNALGFEYRTLFFRPPGMDGFTDSQGQQRERLMEIVADKGMFTILWDIELVYALRNETATVDRITRHVLDNAQGGSIVLLHFSENDIAALPAIITGLRDRGLEPCSLSELLLADPEA